MYSFSFTKGFYPTGFFLSKVLMRHAFCVLSAKGECYEDSYGRQALLIMDELILTSGLMNCLIVGIEDDRHTDDSCTMPLLPPINRRFIF